MFCLVNYCTRTSRTSILIAPKICRHASGVRSVPSASSGALQNKMQVELCVDVIDHLDHIHYRDSGPVQCRWFSFLVYLTTCHRKCILLRPEHIERLKTSTTPITVTPPNDLVIMSFKSSLTCRVYAFRGARICCTKLLKIVQTLSQRSRYLQLVIVLCVIVSTYTTSEVGQD
jgi:hypothetical protein